MLWPLVCLLVVGVALVALLAAGRSAWRHFGGLRRAVTAASERLEEAGEGLGVDRPGDGRP